MTAIARTRRSRRQAGVALLTAILITAIAAIAAAAMASRQHLDIRRTANVVELDQAYLFGIAVESWAQEILAADRRETTVDHPGEPWAMVLPPIAVEDATVRGQIEDMQGRFNLNNVVDGAGNPVDDEIERFRRLLGVLGQPAGIADALVDWIDPDAEMRFPDGAEDEIYLAMEPPYRAANSPMVHVSELLLVNGVTAEAFEALVPHVAALPERTTVNVNTATVPVLMALAEGMTEAEAEQLVADRGSEGYQTMEDFLSHPVLMQRMVNIPNVAVASNYFMMNGLVELGHSQLVLHTLVRRTDDGQVMVVMRHQGSF